MYAPVYWGNNNIEALTYMHIMCQTHTSGKLLHRTGSSGLCSLTLEGWGGDKREAYETGDIGLHTVYSYCYTPETNHTSV